MKKLIIFLSLIPFLSFAKYEKLVDPLFSVYNNSGVPGASVGIIEDGKLVYGKGFGLNELRKKAKSSEKTNYRLASVSKQFTAMAIAILVDEGKLDLNHRLTDIFKSFPSYGKNIRIRHLIHHQSGLRDYESLLPSGLTKQVLDRDVLDIMMKQRSTYFTPGSQYRYSNSGYAVLAEVVREVSGQSFAEFLEKEIFSSLGMVETVAFEKGISTVSNRAYGHTRSGSGFRQTDQSSTSAVLGDGGVYTSVSEYAHWDKALYSDRIVSASMMRKIFEPGVLNSGAKTSYGFGWMLDSYRGLRRQKHTGSTIGFRTAVQRYPSKKTTILVLINRAGSSPWTIAERIADKIFFP